MNTEIEKVKEFHLTSMAPMYDKPTMAAKDRALLRVRLMQEELDEMKEAIEAGDLSEVLDALVDQEYILKGTVLEFGMQHVFDEAFDEVHGANMTKFTEDMDVAQESCRYHHKAGTDCYYVMSENRYVILRKSDKKVLKPITFRAKDLKKFLA